MALFDQKNFNGEVFGKNSKRINNKDRENG